MKKETIKNLLIIAVIVLAIVILVLSVGNLYQSRTYKTLVKKQNNLTEEYNNLIEDYNTEKQNNLIEDKPSIVISLNSTEEIQEDDKPCIISTLNCKGGYELVCIEKQSNSNSNKIPVIFSNDILNGIGTDDSNYILNFS